MIKQTATSKIQEDKQNSQGASNLTKILHQIRTTKQAYTPLRYMFINSIPVDDISTLFLVATIIFTKQPLLIISQILQKHLHHRRNYKHHHHIKAQNNPLS